MHRFNDLCICFWWESRLSTRALEPEVSKTNSFVILNLFQDLLLKQASRDAEINSA